MENRTQNSPQTSGLWRSRSLGWSACALVAVFWLGAACSHEELEAEDGGESRYIEISEALVSGKVGGMDWEESFADTGLEGESSETWTGFRMVRDAGGRCQRFGPETPASGHVSFVVPRREGAYLIGVDKEVDVLFSPPSGARLSARYGRVVVDHVSRDKVQGRIYAVHSSDNEIEGSFEAILCPPQDQE